MSLKHRLAFVATLIIPLSAGACASAPARTTAWDAPEPTTHTVVVENLSWQNLTVFVVRSSGGFHRLGRVESLRSETFSVPAEFAYGSDVQLVGRSASAAAQRQLSAIHVPHTAESQLRSRGEYVTAPFTLMRAMHIRWTINNDDRFSSVFIR
jgi:hypothetical protein